MITTPWPHQKEAIKRIIELGGRSAVFAEMGSGKTVIALGSCEELDCRTILVLCPKSVIPVWKREVEKHIGPNEWRVYAPTKGAAKIKAVGVEQALREGRREGRPVMVVLNYEASITEALRGILTRNSWDMLICDESHRAKGQTSQASFTAYKIAQTSRHRLILTGTPMPHGPLDLWAQARIVDSKWFGAIFQPFKCKYARMVKRTIRRRRVGQVNPALAALLAENDVDDDGWEELEIDEVVGYQNLDELQDRLKCFANHIRTADVLDLPGIEDHDIPIEMPVPAARKYKTLRDELMIELEHGTLTVSNALSKGVRLMQLTSGVISIEGRIEKIHSAKEDALADLLEDLAPSYGEENEPVVVFGLFHTDLDAIHRAAKKAGRSSMELSGRNHAQFEQWQCGEADVLAVQIQAGGVGVDMSRARYACYYALPWSLGDYEQSRARLHRPGQTRRCHYYHLVCGGSMDEVVRRALAAKTDVVTEVLDDLRKGKAN